MRIVCDELWKRVKEHQRLVCELFDFPPRNRLKTTHPPDYLLSDMLQCPECGGSYAISSKDHYSCINRKKRLPIDDLGGECCGNSKTITRHEFEERVPNCIPVAFYSLEIFDLISHKMIAVETGKLKAIPSRKDETAKELCAITRQQKNLAQ
ncbi:hypothetical protein [Rhizobium rosettiformans]|uniref:hypothetical protein n=1 Tax=Rhizobium rosettiformans TaxID=1368430 RepID=UPI0028581CA9|nr:hypothetical protein [Rhizobium rosettiformans]MDR7030629.1 hypothetical protein [Rhizobium rosettiformans]MDR7066506.1 hypothetical protein [Rhizobium rosettiformans]